MNILELKRAIKKKKPKFVRQDAHKKGKLKAKWRRPKGLHSKMRLGFKGYRICVVTGYGSPKEVKNLDRNVLKVKIVSNVNELDKIDVKKEGIIIAKSVGKKKRLDLLKKALELNVKVLNVKDVKKASEKIEEDFKKRVEKKKSTKEKKKEKEKELKKKAKEKEEKKEGLAEKIESEEEKKEKEKKEKDKLLTKKDVK